MLWFLAFSFWGNDCVVAQESLIMLLFGSMCRPTCGGLQYDQQNVDLANCLLKIHIFWISLQSASRIGSC